jgi:hypothetical protein
LGISVKVFSHAPPSAYGFGETGQSQAAPRTPLASP